MGNHLLRVIYNAFVSTPPLALSIYDEICGITLSMVLDAWFDAYELGLVACGSGAKSFSLIIFYS